MDTKRSPLAPVAFPEMPAVAGVALAADHVGIRYKKRTDVLFATLEEGTTVAGTFTKSKTAAAPVDWCRSNLAAGSARALLVNSGNANAFTGKAGKESASREVAAVAKLLDCEETEVFIASTGVIGEPLPDGKITGALKGLKDKLGESGWEDAAQAIMTTDTFPKGASRTAEIGGETVTICGIAKGSGMIAPDMATMLAFIFTDAAIAADDLQGMLTQAVDKSFNAITVDSDTSTSDTVLAFATGAVDVDGDLAPFAEALDAVCLDLAHQIVRDGEGATKFVTITVTGAEDDRAAKTIALAIANSPLVKTAVAGEDPNWGRIVMAVGKAGEAADRDNLAIRIGDHLVAKNGEVVPGYDETPVARYMKGDEIAFIVDVGVASGTATVWTCDLTHEYISINADYRS